MSAANTAEDPTPGPPMAGGANRHRPFHLATLTRWQKLRIFGTTVVNSFIANRCPVRASALAYSNLLAVIPVLAVVISITSGLLKQEGQDRIERFIEQMVATVTPEAKSVFGQLQDDPKMAEARKEVAARIQEFIQNTRSGAIGVTGTVALLFVGIGMLVRIENTFNDMWGISEGRTWFSRIAHYWAAMTLGPLLLVAAIALTGSPYLQTLRDFLASLPLSVGQTVMVSLGFAPFVILILAFAAFYKLMPHTQVDWRAALMGGLVGGTLWQLNNQLGVFYASKFVTESYIYGGLGLVPVIMVGLYLSWMILLFGAQVAYVFQNRRVYFQERQLETFSQAGREWVAVQVMIAAGRAFKHGRQAPGVAELAGQLEIPTRLASQVLRPLTGRRLLVEVAQKVTGYMPARSPESISLDDILSAMRLGDGEDPAAAVPGDPLAPIRAREHAAAAGVTLGSLLEARRPDTALP